MGTPFGFGTESKSVRVSIYLFYDTFNYTQRIIIGTADKIFDLGFLFCGGEGDQLLLRKQKLVSDISANTKMI